MYVGHRNRGERERKASVIIASAAQSSWRRTSNIPRDRLVWGCATVSPFLILEEERGWWDGGMLAMGPEVCLSFRLINTGHMVCHDGALRAVEVSSCT
jgi:hypothetical protein